jgi:hypothetical protein
MNTSYLQGTNIVYKLIVTQLVIKFYTFYGREMPIIVFITIQLWTLYLAK